MNTFFEKISEDLVAALKGRDEVRVSTLRYLISKVNNAKIEKGSDLTDVEILNEINKEVKRHQESIDAYRAGGRQDLVDKEESELAILRSYLPKPFSDEELDNMVDEAIQLLDAKSEEDVGRVIKAVMSSASVRANGAKVAEIAMEKIPSK